MVDYHGVTAVNGDILTGKQDSGSGEFNNFQDGADKSWLSVEEADAYA